MAGGTERVFAAIVYAAADLKPLVPLSHGSMKVLTVPVGLGFRVAISRNEKSLSRFLGGGSTKRVRATNRAFSEVPRLAGETGFQMDGLTLSRGSREIVNVRNDPLIAEEMYAKEKNDTSLTLDFIGLSSRECRISMDSAMNMQCTNFSPEAGNLVYSVVSEILKDEPVYRTLENAFQPKRDETWAAMINPVGINGNFHSLPDLAVRLSAVFPGDAEFSMEGKSGLGFSSPEGSWGNIVASPDGLQIMFQSAVDFDFGIRLMDALGRVSIQ